MDGGAGTNAGADMGREVSVICAGALASAQTRRSKSAALVAWLQAEVRNLGSAVRHTSSRYCRAWLREAHSRTTRMDSGLPMAVQPAPDPSTTSHHRPPFFGLE